MVTSGATSLRSEDRKTHTTSQPQPFMPSFTPTTDQSIPPVDDPLSVWLSSFTQSQDGMNTSEKDQVQAPPSTRWQSILPLVHLVIVWALVAYFVLREKTPVFNEKTHGVVSNDIQWRRWAELCCRNLDDDRREIKYMVIFVAHLAAYSEADDTPALFLGILDIPSCSAFHPYIHWLCEHHLCLDVVHSETLLGCHTTSIAPLSCSTSLTTSLSIHYRQWTQVPPNG